MFSSVIGIGGIVTNGSASSPSQSGAVYWDGNNRAFAIIDNYGNKNQVYPQMTSVGLDATSINAIAWVTKKMQEEKELEELCKLHPGLKDVKEKFDIMLALVRQKNDNVG